MYPTMKALKESPSIYSTIHKLYQGSEDKAALNNHDSKTEKRKLFCDGEIHVKTRTLAIGMCEILLHVFCFIGASIYVYSHVNAWKTFTTVTIALMLILIPIYVCYFAALFTKNQFLFIFYLVIAAIRLIFFVICIDALVLIMVLSLDFGNKKHIIIQTIAFTIVAIISSAIQIRWMLVVIKCMKYFDDIKRHKPSDIVLKY